MSKSTSASSSTNTNEVDSSVNNQTRGLLGGDFAGYSATFDCRTGQLVPVPEHLVPEAMVEWGDIPNYFEVLTSEDINEESVFQQRTVITALPEVGCGIDNLEVTKRVDTFDGDVQVKVWDKKIGTISIERRSDKGLELETMFETKSELDGESGKSHPHRIRLSISVDKQTHDSGECSYSISKLNVQVERQYTSQSSRGVAWLGPAHNSGGLDARTVSNMIGGKIVSGDVFSVKRLKGGGDVWTIPDLSVLEGMWAKSEASSNPDEVCSRPKSNFDGSSDDSIVIVRLPQNLLVRYGSIDGAWKIEVSHFTQDMSGDSSRYTHFWLVRDKSGAVSSWSEVM